MECSTVKSKLLALLICGAAAAAGGCNSGLYGKLTPAYDLVQNQDKKILILVESPRYVAADIDAPEKLSKVLQDHLIKAKVKPQNLRVQGGSANTALVSPEQAAQQAGAQLVLFVRIEDYELLPVRIRDFYSARMLTRAALINAEDGAVLWPLDGDQGKLHDIAIEMGKGGRQAVLTQMTESTAHCIVRNLYPIEKLYYRNSDERIAVQQAFDMDTF